MNLFYFVILLLLLLFVVLFLITKKGSNRAESAHVKLGASHTLTIELNRDLTIIKDEWDRFVFF